MGQIGGADSQQLYELNEDDNINVINEDDCNSNCITQDTLDDLPLTQKSLLLKKLRHLNYLQRFLQYLYNGLIISFILGSHWFLCLHGWLMI